MDAILHVEEGRMEGDGQVRTRCDVITGKSGRSTWLAECLGQALSHFIGFEGASILSRTSTILVDIWLSIFITNIFTALPQTHDCARALWEVPHAPRALAIAAGISRMSESYPYSRRRRLRENSRAEEHEL